MIRVYLSASSREHERAVYWAEVVRSNPDLRLVSTWQDTAKSWAGNDARLPLQDQQNVARVDLNEVRNSDVIWLLYPTEQTCGAFVELGFALAWNRRVLSSGPACTSSIFTSLTSRFSKDADAYREIVRLSCVQTQPMTFVQTGAST